MSFSCESPEVERAGLVRLFCFTTSSVPLYLVLPSWPQFSLSLHGPICLFQLQPSHLSSSTQQDGGRQKAQKACAIRVLRKTLRNCHKVSTYSSLARTLSHDYIYVHVRLINNSVLQASMYQTKKCGLYCSGRRGENISEAISSVCHKNVLERIALDK